VTKREARQEVVEYWMRKAEVALDSARSEYAAKRYDFAINRTYYACFYSASGVLLKAGRKFVKHAGVRGAVHQDLVKSGLLDRGWGKVFDRIFESRQWADYLELYEFEPEEVAEKLEEAAGFVAEMRRLLSEG